MLQLPLLCTALELEEHELKAVFLLNFSRVIQWPEHLSSVSLCVVGDNPFAHSLEGMVAEFNKTSAVPRSVDYFQTIDNLDNCQIIYVEMSRHQQAGQIIAKVAHKVLTVSSIDGFVYQGGIIQFYPKDDKLRFYINTKALSRSGLKIDANLLRVGDLVEIE